MKEKYEEKIKRMMTNIELIAVKLIKVDQQWYAW